MREIDVRRATTLATKDHGQMLRAMPSTGTPRYPVERISSVQIVARRWDLSALDGATTTLGRQAQDVTCILLSRIRILSLCQQTTWRVSRETTERRLWNRLIAWQIPVCHGRRALLVWATSNYSEQRHRLVETLVLVVFLSRPCTE